MDRSSPPLIHRAEYLREPCSLGSRFLLTVTILETSSLAIRAALHRIAIAAAMTGLARLAVNQAIEMVLAKGCFTTIAPIVCFAVLAKHVFAHYTHNRFIIKTLWLATIVL